MTARARVYSTPPIDRDGVTRPRYWVGSVPGYGWTLQSTQQQALATVGILLSLAARSPWQLPVRVPGATLAEWPDVDRRDPADECDACLTHTDDPPNR